jgi:hypothetical protein
VSLVLKCLIGLGGSRKSLLLAGSLLLLAPMCCL